VRSPESSTRWPRISHTHQAELIERNRLASIGQLAAGVAHEINNPIGVMLGYVMLLRKDAALADREELTIIEDELRQCQVIVAGLLDPRAPGSAASCRGRSR
jgi:two-component system NtrC family sensor kinase